MDSDGSSSEPESDSKNSSSDCGTEESDSSDNSSDEASSEADSSSSEFDDSEDPLEVLPKTSKPSASPRPKAKASKKILQRKAREELLQTRFEKLSTRLFSSGEVKEICTIVEKKLTQDTKLLQSCESHKNVIEGFLDGTCHAQRLLLVTGMYRKFSILASAGFLPNY